MVRLLAVRGERCVCDIAKAMGMRGNYVSDHLRRLAAVGIVWKRRSGVFVYYRLAEEPARPLTREVVKVLRGVFAHVRVRKPGQVVFADQHRSQERSDVALFACFTAFTHPRRLQVIRYLWEHGDCAASVLGRELRMSPAAWSRHLDKLARRGIVSVAPAGREILCALAPCQGQVVGDVLAVVLTELTTSRSLQTSGGLQ